MFAERLKKSILQAAIQGQLTEQLPTDGDARRLLKKIRAEKSKLIADKKIKADKILPPITDDEIPFDLPANWCWCRLGEIFYVRSANRIHQSDWKNTGVPFLRGRELVQLAKGNKLFPEIFITEELYQTLKKKSGIPSKDDILISAVGTIGKVYIVKGIKKFYYKDAYILCLENFGHLLAKLIKFFIESPFLQKQIHQDSMATTVKQLTIEKTKSLLFPLPPLAEQKRIVERVDALLIEVEELARAERELIELEKNFPRRMKNSLLQAAIQGQLTEQLPTDGDARHLLKKIRAEKSKLIADKKIKADKILPPITDDEIPFDLPANWCWCRLGEVALKIHYGFTASANSTGNVKLLRITDIQNDKVRWENVPCCNVTDSQKKEYLLQIGDIVVARTGGTVGKSFIVENLLDEAVFASYLIRLVLSKNISPKYIKIFTGSPLYWKQIIDKIQGTGQPNVNGKSLSNLIVPLPPLAEQKRIVERLNELLPLCEW